MKKKNKSIKKHTPLAETKLPQTESYHDYQDNGLLLTREVATGQAVKIIYSGLLAQNGATDIYAHAGVGEYWDNIQDIKMIKTTTDQFEATLLFAKQTQINICFRNENNDWDNNGTYNYSYYVN